MMKKIIAYNHGKFFLKIVETTSHESERKAYCCSRPHRTWSLMKRICFLWRTLDQTMSWEQVQRWRHQYGMIWTDYGKRENIT
jgi:hypothetical protein